MPGAAGGGGYPSNAAPPPVAGGDADGAAPGTAPRRRRGPPEVQEVVDELAQEQKRTTLLDKIEQQLAGKPRCSRLLFGFSVPDDRRVHAQVDEEFEAWRETQERQAEDLTGLLVFSAQGAAHFLEGPTELLFAALRFFNSLSKDSEAPAAPRPALVGHIRVFHFTELRGVRTSLQWTSLAHGGKPMGGQQPQLDETSCPELTFRVYQKFLFLCLKVKEELQREAAAKFAKMHARDEPEEGEEGEEEEEPAFEMPIVETASLQKSYKKVSDTLPTVDEIAGLLGKSAADYLFSVDDFEKVFIAPFQLVLHSELLWPMPPALSY